MAKNLNTRSLTSRFIAVIAAGLVALTGCGPAGVEPTPIDPNRSMVDAVGQLEWMPAVTVERDEYLVAPKTTEALTNWFDISEEIQADPYEPLDQTHNVQAYLDPHLTMPIETTAQASLGEQGLIISVTSPTKSLRSYEDVSRDGEVQPREDIDPRDAEPLAADEDDPWGSFSSLYIVQRTDNTGELLEQPQVTPVRVADTVTLPAPSLEVVDGQSFVTWDRDAYQDVEEMRVVRVRSYPMSAESEGWTLTNDFEGFEINESSREAGRLNVTLPRKLIDQVHGVNGFLATAPRDITSFDSTTMATVAQEYFSRVNAAIFLNVKRDGKWQASELYDYTGQASQIPMKNYRDYTSGDQTYPAAKEVPATVPVMTIDGQIRDLPYDIDSTEELSTRDDAGIRNRANYTVRGSVLEGDIVYHTGQDNGTTEEVITRAAEYTPKGGEIGAAYEIADISDGWLEASDGNVNLDDVTGSNILVEYIAANLQAGYNEMSLEQFPEASTSTVVGSALTEAANQNPLMLGIDGRAGYHYDASTKMLRVEATVMNLPEDAQLLPADGSQNDEVMRRMITVEDRGDYLDLQEHVGDRVQQVVADLQLDDLSDAQKVQRISDWLAENVEYDYAYLNALDNASSLVFSGRPLAPQSTAVGALLHGQAVCGGYAQGFQALAQAAGLESIYISGNVGSVGHAWNKVNIDGEWLNVDPTWNDEGATGSDQYTLLTDTEIREAGPRTIDWGRAFFLRNGELYKN